MATDQSPQDETMNSVLSVNELERLKQGLDDLPETMPPRSVWHRIEEQAHAEGLLSKPAASQRTKWLAGVGIAAAVVLAVLRLPGAMQPNSIPGGEELTSTPVFDAQSIDALMVQSQQLEHELRAITYQPRMMRASRLSGSSLIALRAAATASSNRPTR